MAKDLAGPDFRPFDARTKRVRDHRGPQRVTRESEWVSKDGTRTRICDMSNDHLRRTLAVIVDMSPVGTRFTFKDASTRTAWISALGGEGRLRGLIATWPPVLVAALVAARLLQSDVDL